MRHPPDKPAHLVLVNPYNGLTTALRDHLDHPVIHFDAQQVPRLAPEREEALLAVVRAVVEQALRSPGTERIDVGLSASEDTLLVLVENRGGDTSRLNHPAGGLSLPHLRTLAAALGGTVDLLLAAHRSGYRVAVTCPCTGSGPESGEMSNCR